MVPAARLMQWIRRHNRLGSWAALFALTIQLVVSFGHIHFDELQVPSAVMAAQSQGQSVPDGDGTTHHDICAICATLSLTASSVVPVVELPATPAEHPHRWLLDLRPARVSSNLHFLFQARAPPSA